MLEAYCHVFCVCIDTFVVDKSNSSNNSSQNHRNKNIEITHHKPVLTPRIDRSSSTHFRFYSVETTGIFVKQDIFESWHCVDLPAHGELSRFALDHREIQVVDFYKYFQKISVDLVFVGGYLWSELRAEFS